MKYLEITATWNFEDANRKTSGSSIIPCSYETKPTKNEIIKLCEERVEHSGRWYENHTIRDISESEFNKHPASLQHSF